MKISNVLLWEEAERSSSKWKQKKKENPFSLIPSHVFAVVVIHFALKEKSVSFMVGFYMEGTYKMFYSV